jgi:hypothetical protein
MSDPPSIGSLRRASPRQERRAPVNLLLEQGLLAAFYHLYFPDSPEETFNLLPLIPDDDIREQVALLEPGPALARIAETFDPTDPVEQFAATQALVLGTSRRGNIANVAEGLEPLAVQLLRRYVPDADTESAAALMDATEKIAGLGGVDNDVIGQLEDLFGDSLTSTTTVGGTLSFEGVASTFVAMLIELILNFFGTHCELIPGTVKLKGKKKAATFVELEVCTGRSFARCAHAIDPANWQECNPIFFKVEVLIHNVTNNGWFGAISERVGPAMNGDTYHTNLSVRCLSTPGQYTVAFGLAPDSVTPHDDGRVTVDRGFLSVTEEGSHRRVRVLKVYRIEKFKQPLGWICPLWASQLVMGGWWC